MQKQSGMCDPPSYKDKKIRIDRSLKKWELFEILLHELLHAGLWDIDEDVVATLSLEIANAFKAMDFITFNE